MKKINKGWQKIYGDDVEAIFLSLSFSFLVYLGSIEFICIAYKGCSTTLLILFTLGLIGRPKNKGERKSFFPYWILNFLLRVAIFLCVLLKRRKDTEKTLSAIPFSIKIMVKMMLKLCARCATVQQHSIKIRVMTTLSIIYLSVSAYKSTKNLR